MKVVIVLAVMLVALSSFPLLSQSAPGARPAAAAAASSTKVEQGMVAAASAAPVETREAEAKLVGKVGSEVADREDRAATRTRSTRKTTDGTATPVGLQTQEH